MFRLTPSEPQPGEALGEFALRVMRTAIRSGQLMPGEHLREADIAKWLRMSRAPVREAFHSIIADGLLVAGPWNGVMVADLDQNQLVELYAVREVLEGAAAELAAKHASNAEIEHMFEIAESELGAKDDAARLVLINSELHRDLCAGGAQSLSSAITQHGDGCVGLVAPLYIRIAGQRRTGERRAFGNHKFDPQPQRETS